MLSIHYLFFLMFIYFSEREGDTEFEAGFRLRAVGTQPDVGLELTECEIMTWAKVGRSTDWVTQAGTLLYFWKFYLFKFYLFKINLSKFILLKVLLK